MKKICPLINKECLEHGCEFWTHLLGQNPQTGAQQDDFGCAIKFLPILLVENASQVRKATASVDKVANEVNQGTKLFIGALPHEAQQRLGLKA